MARASTFLLRRVFPSSLLIHHSQLSSVQPTPWHDLVRQHNGVSEGWQPEGIFNILNLFYHFAHWKTMWIYDVVYCWIKTSFPKSHGIWTLQLLSCFRKLQFIYQENHSSEVQEVFHSLKLWHSYASLKGKGTLSVKPC